MVTGTVKQDVRSLQLNVNWNSLSTETGMVHLKISVTMVNNVFVEHICPIRAEYKLKLPLHGNWHGSLENIGYYCKQCVCGRYRLRG